MKLTDRAIETAQCPAGAKDKLFFDETLPGFGLRVTARGARVFICQYNIGGGKKRRAILGTWGTELTAAQARRKAEALRGQVRDSRDPVAERKAARAAAKLTEAQAKAATASASYTVDALIQAWTNDRLAQRSESYATRVPREMRAALKKWRNVSAASFTRADAVVVLDVAKSGSGPIAANRLRAVSRACWGWAVKRGTLESNPWEATPRPQERERPRERVLDLLEVRAVYEAAGELVEPFGALVRTLILTGQRRGEVAGIEWAELDLDAAVWSLPGTRTKNGRPHTVPLCPEVLAVLGTVKHRKGATFVFEGPRKTAVSGFGKIKAYLDEAVAKMLARPLHAWVLHDLRRSCATGLQRLGVRLEVTEAVLNHVSGSRAGIVGVYQQHGFREEKVAALQAWSREVTCAVDASNVVRFSKTG